MNYALGFFLISTNLIDYNIPLVVGVAVNTVQLTVPGFSRPVAAGDFWGSIYCQE